MPKFNPFHKVNAAYGAPMGRQSRGREPETWESLHITPAKGDGYYDKGGAYWGSSDEGPVWAVHNNDGSFVRYVRSHTNWKSLEKALEDI